MVEFITAIIYIIRQGAQFIQFDKSVIWGGNLDPFYLIAPIFLVSIMKDRVKLNKWFGIVIILISYSIIQIIFNPEINILKLSVNIIKIVGCLMIMIYIKNYYNKISFPHIIVYASIMLGTFTLFALFYNQSVLWILNDTVNKYDLIRLKLLYLEPSELGFHVLILLVFLIGFLLKAKLKSTKIVLTICIVMDFFVLFYTKSIGAIIIGALSILVMITMDWYTNKTTEKTKIYLGVIAVAVGVLIVMISTKSSILMRVFGILQGQDASIWYRVKVSFDVTFKAVWDFKGLGFGFGNLNTPGFLVLYKDLGFVHVLVNSFLYFIVEGGVFAIVFIMLLFSKLFNATISSKSIIKWGLLIFLIVYQFFGSHFTNALIWILYGIILSEFDEFSYSEPIFKNFDNWIETREG